MNYKDYHLVKVKTGWELRLKNPTETKLYPTLKEAKAKVNKLIAEQIIKKAMSEV